MATKTMVFEKDLANNKLNIERSFDGSLERVWQAWTDAGILDQWWAPKPYRAETKKMDCRTGGIWLYAMLGPEGDGQNCRVDYTSVSPMTNISSKTSFCDEEGNYTNEFPFMYWNNTFNGNDKETTITMVISFDSREAMEKYLELGFKEGFEAGLQNLDEVLAK